MAALVQGNKIGSSGATSLSELLKTNTTLTWLDLSSLIDCFCFFQSFVHGLFPFYLIGNEIQEAGAASLSESLKVNTTLSYLNLICKQLGPGFQNTKKEVNRCFLDVLTGNKIGDTGATAISDALKTNTTLTELDLGGDNQQTISNKNKHFFFSITSDQQEM